MTRHCQIQCLLFLLTFFFHLEPVFSDVRADGKRTAERATTADRHLLDGKSFGVHWGDGEADPSKQDVIHFIDGRFTSMECKRLGFKSKSYSSKRRGGAIHFHAEVTSPKYGRMVWSGTVKDGRFEANVTWTRNRWYWNIHKEYQYHGRLLD